MIEQNRGSDFNYILLPFTAVLKTFPLLSGTDVEQVKGSLLAALESKGVTPEDANIFLSNAFDGFDDNLRFKLMTAEDILNNEYPEPPWVVPNLLCVGLSGLGGKQKLGKSWLALQFACAVAHGGSIFGMRVERAPILYIATEDPPRRLKDRMLTQGWDMQNRLAHFMTINDFRSRIGDLNGRGSELLAELVRANRYKLVVIDTFSRTFSGDQNDAHKMTQALSPLHAAAHELETAILIIDHHHKGLTDKRDPVNDVLGSTAKGAVVDTALGLYRERGKPEAELHICGRDIEDGVMPLKMDRSTGMWQRTDIDKSPSVPGGQAIIVAYLAGTGEASLKEICIGVGKDYGTGRGTIHKDLSELISKGIVVKSEDNTYRLNGSSTLPTYPLQQDNKGNRNNSTTEQQHNRATDKY
jgi:hypothetical protein